MQLALFFLEAAAGLYLFLPWVGRRNAGAKFYRMILVIAATLVFGAAIAHAAAHRPSLVYGDVALLVAHLLFGLVFRFPTRRIYAGAGATLGIAYIIVTIAAWHATATPPHLLWSVLGAISSIAALGSINLAMILGHWYLVVRGMAIDPLKRLAIATAISTGAKLIVVGAGVLIAGSAQRDILIGQGIFFWMRVGWGLAAPLGLFPMVWGTVKIRSTMAATGILYVDVVAIVIGEVLGNYLSALFHLPL